MQIQNATGCVLKVQTGVGSFTIQGLAASTIPTDNQLPLTLNPTSGYTNFSEYVTVIWLLDGQSSPMADGSISAPYTPGTPLSSVATSVTLTQAGNLNAPVQLLPAPSTGTYQLYNMVITYVSGEASSVRVVVFNTTSDTTIYDPGVFSAFQPGLPPIVYSLGSVGQQSGAIGFGWYGYMSTNPVVNITLNYFLVNS